MSDRATSPATVTDLGVAGFTVANQDAALARYVEKLGFELRADVRFGTNGKNRWLDVGSPRSIARLVLHPPMTAAPGGGMIAVQTPPDGA